MSQCHMSQTPHNPADFEPVFSAESVNRRLRSEMSNHLHQRERSLCFGALIEAAAGEGVQALGDLGGADDKTTALIQGTGSNYKSKAVV